MVPYAKKSFLFMPAYLQSHKKLYFCLWLAFVTSIAGTIALVSRNQTAPTHQTASDVITGELPELQELANGEKLADKTSIGILLLGYGGPGHSGGFLTDVVQVLKIDFAAKKVSLISIPRDLWVTTKTGASGKINEAFATGMQASNFGSQPGVATAKQMAAQVTGIPVDFFIGIDFVGLQRVIGEELDGIDVSVSETLDDPWYPVQGLELETCGMTPEEVARVSQEYSGFELEKQFPCRYKRVYFPAGKQHMEGGDALEYVRSRHGSGSGDFSRSKRQHEVLQAVVDKLLKLNAFDTAVAFFDKLSHTITTDISSDIVAELAPQVLLATQFPKKTVILSTENVFTTSKSSSGQFILIPKTGSGDWQFTQDFIREQTD